MTWRWSQVQILYRAPFSSTIIYSLIICYLPYILKVYTALKKEKSFTTMLRACLLLVQNCKLPCLLLTLVIFLEAIFSYSLVLTMISLFIASKLSHSFTIFTLYKPMYFLDKVYQGIHSLHFCPL